MTGYDEAVAWFRADPGRVRDLDDVDNRSAAIAIVDAVLAGAVPAGRDLTANDVRDSFLLVLERGAPDGWMALGPNGQLVAALLERVRRMTSDELDHADAARDAAWNAAWAAAWNAARDAARDTARDAAWVAAGAAARDAARDAAWVAARDTARDAAWVAAGAAAGAAAWALVVRDLITPEQVDALTGPLFSVIGTDWMESDR